MRSPHNNEPDVFFFVSKLLSVIFILYFRGLSRKPYGIHAYAILACIYVWVSLLFFRSLFYFRHNFNLYRGTFLAYCITDTYAPITSDNAKFQHTYTCTHTHRNTFLMKRIKYVTWNTPNTHKISYKWKRSNKKMKRATTKQRQLVDVVCVCTV